MNSKETPLIEARNIGPIVAAELESIGISSLEKMQLLGWEDVCFKYGEAYPERINLNAFTGIIGAIENQDWRSIDEAYKKQARNLINKIKSSLL